MIRAIRLPALRSHLCAAAACMMLAGAAWAQEPPREGFPLLADMPERPEAISADVRENARRYREWVAQLQAERSEMLERLRHSRRQEGE